MAAGLRAGVKAFNVESSEELEVLRQEAEAQKKGFVYTRPEQFPSHKEAENARAEGRPLTGQDWWITKQVGPTLKAKGLVFVGLDVIGDKLTEINVTSPTCVQELDKQFGLNIAGLLMDHIEKTLTQV